MKIELRINLVDSTKGQQMKKLLVLAALTTLASPAFASKARLSALGNAAHLIDTQTVFQNPSHLVWMSDYATFETGPTSATSTTLDAEGGFVRSNGDAKWGAYLGRKSAFTTGYRALTGFAGQENPIELQYAMKGAVNWGAALNYSSSDRKSISKKQSSYGVRLGASTDVWEAYAVIGLGSEATGNSAAGLGMTAADTSSKFKGTTGFQVGGAYKVENLYSFITYYQDGFKLETTANAAANDLKVNQSQVDIGVVDHNKIDAGQWFYGVSYRIFENKRDGAATALESKTNTTSLPFLLGLEYDAISWATLRASVTQNVLLGSTKTEVTPAVGNSNETDTIANNTTVAAGVGLKFNKFVVDGSWAAQTTGDVNTTNFLTNVALTYMF
jgi:hypothetical protein